MGLQLLSIQDPRDNLDKARRFELLRHAKANGVTDVSEGMPAILIRKKLRQLGLTNIVIPARILGQPEVRNRAVSDAGITPAENIAQVDADDDLERQFAADRPKNPHTMAYNELRRFAKTIGVTFGRKDNLASMKAKVAAAMQKGQGGGENPS